MLLFEGLDFILVLFFEGVDVILVVFFECPLVRGVLWVGRGQQCPAKVIAPW